MARIFRRRGPDGAWIKTWYCWVPDLETGGTRKVSTRCTDKVAAQRRADQLERDALDPDSAAAAKATLRDAIGLLLRDRASEVVGGKMSAATVEFYQKKGGVLLDALPEVLQRAKDAPIFLREVTAALVDDYIMQRRDDGAKDSTIHKELTTWRASMRLAKRRRLWRGDIDEVFPVGFSPGYKPVERYLKPEELVPLYRGFVRPTKYRGGGEGPERGHELFAIAAFMIASSAEWSATWRALREDIAPDLSTVRVRGEKNANRDRDVPLELPQFRFLMAYVVRYADGQNLLFLNREGNFRHRLSEACERAGIPHLSPNDLRRTHAKWLRLAGAAPSTIAPSMGHADSRMVERVYGKASAVELARVQAAEIAATGGLLMGGDPVETGPSRADESTTKPRKGP